MNHLSFNRLLIFFSLVWISTYPLAQSAEYVDSLIQDIPNVKEEDKIWQLSDISYYASQYNANLSLEYAQKCLKEALIFGDSLLIAEGLNALSIAFYSKGAFEKGLQTSFKALDIRKRHGDAYSLLSSYSKIANNYYELGQYDEAIEYNKKSLKICETNDLKREMGMIANNIGSIFSERDRDAESEKYFLIAIQTAEEDKDTLILARAMVNLAIAYRNLGKPEAADSVYAKTYRMIENKNYLELEGTLFSNWGVVYENDFGQERNIKYFKKALEISKKTNETAILAYIYSNIGNAYLTYGKTDSAKMYVLKGVQFADSTGSLPIKLTAYGGLIKYYRNIKDYTNAFKYDSLVDVYTDSIYTLESEQAIQELDRKYQTEKKEKILAQQKQELTNSQIREDRKNNLIYASAAGIVLLLLLIIIIYRNQKIKRDRLTKEMELQSAVSLNKLQQEKLRISRDLHDSIGAQLTFMISSLDNMNYVKDEEIRKKKLHDLGSFAKDTMNQLRASIWTLKSEEMTAEEFVAKVSEFINRAKSIYPQINFEIKGQSIIRKLEANEVLHLFRTIQEAINNAIKYSNATVISFITSENGFTIADNGQGFNLNAIVRGNGLANMQNRIQEIGGNFKLDSAPGRGTSIHITLPLNK